MSVKLHFTAVRDLDKIIYRTRVSIEARAKQLAEERAEGEATSADIEAAASHLFKERSEYLIRGT